MCQIKLVLSCSHIIIFVVVFMGLCTARQVCITFVFGFCIIYTLIYTLIKYEYEQTCNGEWGTYNPPMRLKTGSGRCEIKYTLRVGNLSLLNLDSYYEGDWIQGRKHGKGTYVSLSGSNCI